MAIPVKLGFVPGHRGVFSQEWALAMRDRCLDAFKKIPGIEVVLPDPASAAGGLVESVQQAIRVAEDFRRAGVNRLLMGTMNFGDEEGLSEIARRLKTVDVSVALFGTYDGVKEDGRRVMSDSFCGTLSASMNLHTAGVPFRFLGIVDPETSSFVDDVKDFVETAPTDLDREYKNNFARTYSASSAAGKNGEVDAAVSAFRDARIGQFGPRAPGFVTCAFDERQLLRHFGQRVIPIDLSQVFGRANRLSDSDQAVTSAAGRVREMAHTDQVPDVTITKMAKLYASLSTFMDENELVAAGHNCWLGIQLEYGICGCGVFSMLEEDGIPITCETDIYGAATMVLQTAIARAAGDETRPFFMDWTIQSPDDSNLFQAWHCGKAPLSVYEKKPSLGTHEIIGPVVGDERAHGTLEGEFKTGVVTLCRLVEYDGKFRALVTRGEVVKSPWANMRGGFGWVRMKDMNGLYRVLIEKGFSHHVSMIHGDYADQTVAVCEKLRMEVVWVD